MMVPLLHHGMLITGVPYDVQALNHTTGGGSPYGPGHVSGPDQRAELSPEEATIAEALGARLARVAAALGS